MPTRFNEKGYSIALYFECILGIISASLALSGLILVATHSTIDYPWMFNTSLTFWICYLIFSIFIIFIGIYEWHQEKNLDKRKPKKKLRAPIR